MAKTLKNAMKRQKNDGRAINGPKSGSSQPDKVGYGLFIRSSELDSDP